MKGAVVIFTSQKDPNGLSQTRQNVLYMLENIKQDLKIIIASEDTKNLIDDLPSGSHERVVAINGNYKNYNQAILTLREMGILDVDLLFLPTPGDYVQIDDHTVTNYIEAAQVTGAGFIISDHYELFRDSNDAEPVLMKLKPGHDPSNIIIPGRANNPVFFCHGGLIAVTRPYINARVFDTDVNYGSDYAIRTGILAQGGQLYTIPKPSYTFRRGTPYFVGEGLQDSLAERNVRKLERHFSYINDPARFEWGPVSFEKYLKDVGAFLPDSYFSRKVPTDPRLGAGISFVMPTYNRAKLLHYAIESIVDVRKRTDPFIPIELIIVDNGTDETPNIVAPYSEQYPELIKFYKTFGKTLGGARNYGVHRAKNRIIGQLDSDDILIGDPVTEILRQFERSGSAAIIGIYQTASRNPETGDLTLDNQIITHDEYLVNQKNPLLQMCIPGPGAPRYYRKEAIQAAGGYPDLLYGEDAALSDQMLKQGFLIERNLSEANYVAVRHGANTDSENLGSNVLLRKNYSKYSFKIAIIEELKHIVLSNSYYHKYNNRVGF
ncbi:MAG: glycosyltransferase family 2 protein [Candidatus Neomarinimicrobiota bacterium]